MANISVIGNDLKIYRAFASLANAAPGKTNFNYHQQYMVNYTPEGYMQALNDVFKNVSDQALGDLMLANLGLKMVFTSAEAEAYMAANADDRVGAVLDMADLLANFSGTTGDLALDARIFDAQEVFNNKIEFAIDWSASHNAQSNFPAEFAGSTFMLTTGMDNLIGTDGVDEFVANVVQNDNGEQTNQLATGDSLEGGAGIDSLFATVQGASALNFFPTSGIALETVGVENASFTALSVVDGGVDVVLGDSDGLYETVVINAKNMVDLNFVASVQSDASLLIQNLTTLQSDDLGTEKDESLYANRRNTEEMTVRMDHSGNDAAVDPESNMTVLFDNDYLLSGQTSNSAIEIRAVNVLALADEAQPLTNITDIQFNVGTVSVVVEVTEAIQNSFNAGAYSSLVTAINARLAELNITTVTVTALPARAVYFSDDVAGHVAQEYAGTYSPILLVASDDSLTKGLVKIDQTAGDFNGFYTQTDLLASAETLIEVQVELNKVGRGGEGGELIIGGMATDYANVWDYSANALEEGIERFNVTVGGDETQYSSLSGLHSTNNTLQEVIVNWETGSLADLIIGNHNTGDGEAISQNGDILNVTSDENDALKDVRLFDAANNNNNAAGSVAATITTDVTLSATITDEAIAKYLDETDTQADPAEEDVHFEYNFGAGNDSLNLAITSTMEVATQLNNRSDFDLAISTGAGNDTVVVQIGDGSNATFVPGDPAATPPTADSYAFDAWYINNNIEDNLSIETGAGNDTIRTNAGGSWIVNAGSNNDAIYSDNSGHDEVFNAGRAVWVLNNNSVVDGNDVDALVSNAHVSSTTARANVSLTMNYFGLTSTVQVGTTHDALGGVVTDLVINQAIKDAINNDNVLSKLLIAEDTASGVLLVRSLTDGDVDTYVPTYTVTSFAPTQVQSDNLVASWGAGIALDTFEIATETLADLNGVDSVVATASTITAGTGNDVVDLSTSGYDTETVFVSDGAADVVFNATNAVITADVFDHIITSNYVTVDSAAGVVTVNDLTVTGSAGNDTIVAVNDLDNILNGGAGSDTITGGTGKDTFSTSTDNGIVNNVVIIGDDGSDIVDTDADVWTDFVGDSALDLDGIDSLDLGAAGSVINYAEAVAAVADYATALIDADTALGGAVVYAFQFDGTNGYVFEDTNADGAADQVVVLVGVDNTEFGFADLV